MLIKTQIQKYLLLFCMILLMHSSLFAQVYINEVCAKNSNTLMDEDGEYPDWIELYNAGTMPVNIQGYGLSNTIEDIAKWTFSDLTIAPQSYLTVFASEKDKKLFIDHWETVVEASGQWKYFVPASPPPPGWRSLGFNDSPWPQGNGGIGYGDGDDNTVLSPPLLTLYMRKIFNIVDTSEIVSAILHIDYDDGFVAYLNNVEIVRSNVGVEGTPPEFDDKAYIEHEAQMYQGRLPERYYIKKSFLKSILQNGNNVLAVEVHNNAPMSSDLSAIPYLSFAINTSSSNYLPTPSWFDVSTASLHTNFALSQNGETVYLSNASSSLIDHLIYFYTEKDNSIGRQPDGTGDVVLFGEPTPTASNNLSQTYTGYVPDPISSLLPGFYISSQSLSITDSLSDVSIYYTTDGSEPLQTDNLFDAPVTIDSTIVIKAKVFDNTGTLLPSNTVVNTYFINESSSLPVVSLSTNPDNLWDWNTGIYIKGQYADSTIPFFGANFWQDWEKEGYVEYFDKQKNLGFEQNIGMKIAGNYSRSNPQKSFKLIARGKYGENSIDYKFFPEKDIYSFKQIVLRNAGNDWNNAHFRDALMHILCLKKTNIDVQEYQPCVLFLNGKYWGVYNIREKINKHYIADNHGIDPMNVDLLQYNGAVMCGTNDDYIQLFQFVTSNNMADSNIFSVVENWIDLDNFIDYFAAETYSDNWDWLVNNVRYWRDSQQAGKWRYILWDVDLGLGSTWSFNFNSLDTNLTKPYDAQSIIMSRLLENISFRHRFINRYADLLNTLFMPQSMNNYITVFEDTLDPEMPRQFARWGNGFNNPAWGIPGHGTYNNWKNINVPQIRMFVNNRPQFARDQIQTEFNLKKQVSVTLNVYPEKAGKILINTVIPSSFPWAGIYYDSVPVTITAIPNPGYEFAFWQSDLFYPLPDTNLGLSVYLDTNDVFTAYFMGSPDTIRICFSEINYNSASSWDAGDWVELYNYGNIDVDISCWTFKDKYGYHKFVIPENTILKKGKYIVLCQDTAKFKMFYPDISNVLGPFSFGLSCFDETLHLYDAYDNEYLNVQYTSALPWPQGPDGNSYTLELIDVWSNCNEPYNWFQGCLGGSPGGPFVPCDISIKQEEAPLTSVNARAFPNPFKQSFTLMLQLNDDAVVRIDLYDIYGRLAHSEAPCSFSAGSHFIHLDFSGFTAGMYICKVIADKKVKSILLQKVE